MDNLRGIGFMVAAMALFAIEDAFIKGVSEKLPTGQILLFIGIGGGTVFALMCRARGIRLLSPVLLTRPLMLRNLSEIVGTLGFVTAITTIPLATASAILQAAPLFVTMGAALFYGEPVGWRRWSAIAVGFVGVLVIIRPGLAGFDPYSLFAVLGVAGLAGRDLASRAIPRETTSFQVATYGFFMAIPTALIMLAFDHDVAMPDPRHWLMIAGAITVGLMGYVAITTAARTGDASAVTTFRYTRLIFALAIGMIIFGERPDALTFLGAALIIGSGLFTLIRERRLARAQARSLAPRPGVG